MFKWWFTLRRMSRVVSGQGKWVRQEVFFPVSIFKTSRALCVWDMALAWGHPWGLNICGGLMMEWTIIWTVIICYGGITTVWFVKTVLLAPPLSIWHALVRHTCTHLIELLHNIDHWLGRKTWSHATVIEALLSNPRWVLLNRLQVMNWLWLLVTNSAFEFVSGVNSVWWQLFGVGWRLNPEKPQSFYHRQ